MPADTNASGVRAEIPPAPFVHSRYPGSLPFQDHPVHRLLFFGRETEAETLFHLILTEDLVVLYSFSGLGKTSLLNAGILPRLRERRFFPLMCRVYAPRSKGVYSGKFKPGPLQAIYASIDQETAKALSSGRLGDRREGNKSTLWEYFKTAEFWSADGTLLTPVLILDQFEELFTLQGDKERRVFAEQLADLVRGTIPKSLREQYKTQNNSSQTPFPYSETPPKVKVLISLREEYLGHLAELAQELPSILRAGFRLTPLQRENAERAIVEPAQKELQEHESGTAGSPMTPVFSYAPNTLKEILDFLCNPEEGEGKKSEAGRVKKNEVDPSQLQLLCQHIEEKVRERLGPRQGGEIIVDQSLLHGRAEMRALIGDFYERVIEKIPPAQRRQVIDLFENEDHGLISPTGRRLSLAQEVIEHQFDISPELLKDLQEKRLLRSDRRLDDFYYELSHDTLIRPILEFRKKREEKRAKKRIIIIAGSILSVIILGSLAYHGSGWIYANTFGSAQYKLHYYQKSGERLFKNGKFKKALDSFRIAVNTAKTINKPLELLPGLYVSLADSYLHLGDYTTAIDNYYNAIKIFKEDRNAAAAYYGLGDAYSAQGNEDEKKGDVYLAQGHYKEAIKNYEKAEQLNPNNLSLLNLAFAYLKIGNRSKAIETINHLSKIMEDRNSDEIRKGYDILINKRGGGEFAPLRVGLGQVYLYETKFEKGKQQFKKAVAIAQREGDPYLPWYYFNLAESYLALENYKEAISFYQKAINSGLTSKYLGNAYFNIGNAYSALKNYPEAITYYRESIKTDKTIYPFALVELANAYLANNNLSEAKENFEKLKIITKANTELKQNPQLQQDIQKLERALRLPQHQGKH